MGLRDYDTFWQSYSYSVDVKNYFLKKVLHLFGSSNFLKEIGISNIIIKHFKIIFNLTTKMRGSLANVNLNIKIHLDKSD